MKYFILLLFSTLLFCSGFSQTNLTPEIVDSILELDYYKTTDTSKRDYLTPSELSQYNFANSDVLDDEISSQDISALLQSSRDPLLQAASFNFNGLRYKFRGYNANETNVLVNGIDMSDPVSGWSMWSVWGGLNDITRYQYSVMGLGSYALSFGGVGGSSNIDARASSVRKGTRLSYALTNRNYRNRIMLTHASGMNKNGWSYVLSGSFRYANEGYIEGTYYNGGSYFAAVEKKINNRHSLNLSVMGAPTVQGMQGAAQQEVFDLLGDHYYNPYWGLQNGQKRNSHERYRHQPLAVLTHYFNVSDKLKLMTSAYALTGTSSTTGPYFYNTRIITPNYYYYLPSYYNQPTDEDMSLNTLTTQNWLNDVNTRQVNWDGLYFANSKNLFTVTDANGISGNTVVGNRSKYYLVEYHEDPTTIGLNNNFTYRLNTKSVLNGGVSYRSHVTHNFALMNDLLGGDYFLDIDQFAEKSYIDPLVAQNDLNKTNHIIYKGDRFWYDYDLHINNANIFANYDVSFTKFDFYAAINASYTSFWRVGNMKNGRYPENSFGKSAVNTYINPGIKAGAIYKISGIQYITVNAAYTSDAPVVDNSYVSPRVKDDLVKGIGNIITKSGDLSYFYRSPKLKARVTAFYTEVNNQTYSRIYYHEIFRNFVNYTMSGVNTLHTGIEASLEANINASWSVTGAYTQGQYIYNSRPLSNISVLNSAQLLAENRVVYLKGYHIGGTPQTLGSIGLKYSGAKFWFVGANVSYFGDLYVEVNPDRRTDAALEKYVDTDPQWNQILEQEKLKSAFLLNFFAGKSFKIKNSYLNLNLTVNNALNNTNIKATGFEQMRYDTNSLQRFPNMYIYLNGLSYFAMVTYRF